VRLESNPRVWSTAQPGVLVGAIHNVKVSLMCPPPSLLHGTSCITLPQSVMAHCQVALSMKIWSLSIYREKYSIQSGHKFLCGRSSTRRLIMSVRSSGRGRTVKSYLGLYNLRSSPRSSRGSVSSTVNAHIWILDTLLHVFISSAYLGP
jgi:hypothetical protein